MGPSKGKDERAKTVILDGNEARASVVCPMAQAIYPILGRGGADDGSHNRVSWGPIEQFYVASGRRRITVEMRKI